MSFLSKLFGKKEKNEVELYMEQRKNESHTYEGTENAGKGSWRENKLLLGDVTQIPEQYYFRKDEDMLFFVDYFHEGIFYSGSYGVDEEEYAAIGLVYSLIQNPEKTVEQWYQKFLEQEKKAAQDSWQAECIVEEIDDVLYTVSAFGLQDCERYILPVAKQTEILDYWFCREDEFYTSMLSFTERLFFLGETESATNLLIKLLGKETIKQEELKEDFLIAYDKMGRMVPEQMKKARETLQLRLTEAGYEDFVQELKKKDSEIIVNPYVNVYEMAEDFFENPQETLEKWIGILKAHEEAMKGELENPPENEETAIGYYLIEEVLEAIETVGRYGFAGVPKCLGENEEWCRFLIYSGCGGNLSTYLNTMYNSNHVEMVEHILEIMKPVGSADKESWNEFSCMLGIYSLEMFEKWDMPEKEEDFEKQADAFSARWAV